MKPTTKGKAACQVGTRKAALDTTIDSSNEHTNPVFLNQALSNSAEDQRARLLAALRRYPVTTFYARRELDCAHPAARVMELRMEGHKIETVWVTDYSQVGKPHRVAKYVLRKECEV